MVSRSFSLYSLSFRAQRGISWSLGRSPLFTVCHSERSEESHGLSVVLFLQSVIPSVARNLMVFRSFSSLYSLSFRAQRGISWSLSRSPLFTVCHSERSEESHGLSVVLSFYSLSFRAQRGISWSLGRSLFTVCHSERSEESHGLSVVLLFLQSVIPSAARNLMVSQSFSSFYSLSFRAQRGISWSLSRSLFTVCHSERSEESHGLSVVLSLLSVIPSAARNLMVFQSFSSLYSLSFRAQRGILWSLGRSPLFTVCHSERSEESHGLSVVLLFLQSVIPSAARNLMVFRSFSLYCLSFRA